MMAILSVGATRPGSTSVLPGRAAPAWARVAARPAWLLLPIAVLLVLASLLFPERQDDEAGYLELARNLADGRYATGRPDALLDADPSYPDLWFGPGLPLALAGLVAWDAPLELIRLAGPLFLFVALVVFFALARRSMSSGAALLATWALALYLPFYTLLPNLHSEPLALLFVVLMLYSVARVAAGAGARWVLAGGAAFAGLALTRVDYGWVLTLVLAAALVWWALSRTTLPRRFVVMCAVGLALCLPWLAYTTAETGRVLQWGNSGALSLYWMSSPHPGDLGDWQQADAVFRDPGLAPHRPFFASLRGLPLPEQNARLERRAVENVVEHPVEYLQNVAANVSRMFFDMPYSRTPQRLTSLWFALPNALLLATVLAVGLLAARVWSSLPPYALPFAIFAGAAFGLHVFVSAYPRMLVPVVPVVVWFAATMLANNVRVVRRPAQDAA